MWLRIPDSEHGKHEEGLEDFTCVEIFVIANPPEIGPADPDHLSTPPGPEDPKIKPVLFPLVPLRPEDFVTGGENKPINMAPPLQGEKPLPEFVEDLKGPGWQVLPVFNVLSH